MAAPRGSSWGGGLAYYYYYNSYYYIYILLLAKFRTSAAFAGSVSMVAAARRSMERTLLPADGY